MWTEGVPMMLSNKEFKVPYGEARGRYGLVRLR